MHSSTEKKLSANPIVDTNNKSIVWHSSIFVDEMSFCDVMIFSYSVHQQQRCTNSQTEIAKKNFAFTSLIFDHAENESRSILCNFHLWGWSSLRLCWKLKFHMEIDIFKVKDALRIFLLFIPFLAHQWRWKAISNFRLCKKLWHWL